jgi:hypothetical protein
VIKVDVLDDVDAQWWNSLVSAHPQGTIYQTTQWAEFVRRYYGARAFFLIARNDGEVAGQLALFRMGRFPDRDGNHPWRDYLKRPINQMVRVLRWYGGPLIVTGADRRDVLSALLDQVNLLARGQRVIALEQGAFPVDHSHQTVCGIPSDFEQSHWGTFVIDLTQSTDVCWERLKGGSARSSIRRAMKLGVEVKDATDSVGMLARCELAHSAAHRLAAWPEAYWAIMHDVMGSGGYRVVGAEYQGRPVAFIPLMVFGRTMHLLKPIQDPECKTDRIPAGDLLMWEAIRLGQALGLARFDLSGVAPLPSTDAQRGISFFKSKWGGDYVCYPILRKRYRGWLM